MSDPTQVQVELYIYTNGDRQNPDSITAVVEHKSGISIAEAVAELVSAIQEWATSFIKYEDTVSVKLYPGGKHE